MKATRITAFATAAVTSLQLRCGHDAVGEAFLTQIWLTILSSRVPIFRDRVLLSTRPIAQDDCPPNSHAELAITALA